MKSISMIKEDLSEWKIEKLENIIEIHDRKRIPLNSKQRSQMEGKYPYCGANGIIDYLNDYIFDGQYLLVAEDGGFWGRGQNTAYLMEGKFWVNNHAHILTAIDGKAINKYLLYFFRYDDIEKYTTGTTRKKLNQTVLKKIEIPLPTLETQKKIVETLEKAEKLKEWRAEADELADEFLKSVFLDMFGDPVKNENNWEIRKLGEVADVVSGVTKGRKLQDKETIFAPYLRVANVQDGYLNLSEIKEIEVLHSDIEKYRLMSGDIVLTEGGDPDKLGRGSVWYNQIPDCIHQNHIFRVRINNGQLNPEYLSTLIGSIYGKIYFLRSAKQTTGIATINSRQLKRFPVLIPPIELQNQFAEIVKQIETLKTHQNQSKQQIDNLFNALMQKAFKGELTC